MLTARKNEALNNYFNVSYMLGDNISLISIMIYIQSKETPLKKIESDLTGLRIDKYSDQLDCILDLKASTLKDIQRLLNT